MTTDAPQLTAWTRLRTRSLVCVGVLLVLIGGWAALVSLVGPAFSFGFDTSKSWVSSERHWLLSVVPGIAVIAGGLLVALGQVGRAWLGAAVAFVAGVWLVLGPYVYGIWSSEPHPVAVEDWKRALLWIGWYAGAGAAAIALASFAFGMLGRRPVAAQLVVEQKPGAAEEPAQAPERSAAAVG